VVLSGLSRPQPRWLFVAFRPPDLYYARREARSQDRWLTARCPAAGWSSVDPDDSTLHRRRYDSYALFGKELNFETCLQDQTNKTAPVIANGQAMANVSQQPSCYVAGETSWSTKHLYNVIDMIVLREARTALRSILDDAQNRADAVLAARRHQAEEQRRLSDSVAENKTIETRRRAAQEGNASRKRDILGLYPGMPLKSANDVLTKLQCQSRSSNGQQLGPFAIFECIAATTTAPNFCSPFFSRKLINPGH
jgi:hypothetical protein